MGLLGLSSSGRTDYRNQGTGPEIRGDKTTKTVLLIWVNNDETLEPGLARGGYRGRRRGNVDSGVKNQ